MPRRNPPLIPSDTSEDVWRRQMHAAAERSVAERLDEFEQLNEAVAGMEADGIRRRHPDYDDHQVLLAAAAALDLIEAEYVVVGSTAAAGWGVARTTRKVDLIAVIPVDAVDALLNSLERDDLYVPSAEVRRVVGGGGSFNVLHMASGGKVDVFVAPDGDAFERSRLDGRISSEVFGVASWISTPEDVVLSKLRWRPESHSEVQWRDCVEIAVVQQLDRDYLDLCAPDLGVVDDLTELLDTAS